MIIRNLFKPSNADGDRMTLPELVEAINPRTSSGQTVTPSRSKNIATAYRCINILSDDVAKMPFQVFSSRTPGKIERIKPNPMMQNLAWLMEVKPNRWMNPFIFKKTLMQWLICYGNAYAWMPPVNPGMGREIFILRSDTTFPVYDKQGGLWYRTTFRNQETKYLPDVEVFRLIINSTDGLNGESVIGFARESLGRQMGAYETQGKFYAQGLNPGGIMWVNGDANKEARQKIRDSYSEAMAGSSNAYRLAVLDNKVTKFEPITMKPIDAQFLQGIEENDLEIANFFGVPLYKLNMGKQAYNSNEQQNLDYLSTSLDPYLVQWEQEALLKWLSETEQEYVYLKFNRDALLRTDAETRSKIIGNRIQTGVLTPNEGRSIEDLSSFPGGDRHYFPSNMAMIKEDGSLETAGNVTQLNIGK